MKNLYYAVGAVLLLVGVLGFVMESPLLGMFEVNTVHNVIHLLSGALIVWAAMKGEDAMRMFGKIFGVVYLLVGVLGFAMPEGDFFGLMTLNMQDNVLHVVLGALFAYFGFMSKPAVAAPSGMQMG